MTGINRHTGGRLDTLGCALQGVEVTLTTRLVSRLMRREFGGGTVELLGRLTTPSLFAAFQQLVGTAIDLWEPRFLVRKVGFTGTAEELRLGHAGLSTEADFRPNALSGDFTVERTVSFSVFFGAGRVQVI